MQWGKVRKGGGAPLRRWMSDPKPGNELIRRRHEMMASLRARGVDPFGTRYPVTHWAGQLAARLGSAGEDEVKGLGPGAVARRIVAMPRHGRTCFAHLIDYNRPSPPLPPCR